MLKGKFVDNLQATVSSVSGNNRQSRKQQHSRRDAVFVRALNERLEDSEKAVSSLDVTAAVVTPSFRSTPWQAEDAEREDRKVARIAFVSESNVCRSVLAELIMREMLEDSPLAGQVRVESRATRDHNIGGKPEEPTQLVAAERGLLVADDFRVQMFDYQKDTVQFDLVLVMDKFDCGDVMREISVFDTINKGGNYSRKVRRLGEFHPELSQAVGSDAQDIDDALYGNVGGEEELNAVRQTAATIEDACRGLLAYLEQLRAESQEDHFPQALRSSIAGKEQLDWLVPPMLQQR